MAKKRFQPKRYLGYPLYERTVRALGIRLLRKPAVVYRSCHVKLHLSEPWQTPALLQSFKNYTLAAQLVLRDIERRKPYERLKRFYNPRTKRIATDLLRTFLEKHYQHYIERYHLDSSSRSTLWATLAYQLASWLVLVSDGKRRGYEKSYLLTREMIIPLGQHKDKRLRDVTPDTWRGYLSLPTQKQCEDVLKTITRMTDEWTSPDELEQLQQQQLNITHYERKLFGDLLPNELREVIRLVTYDLERIDAINALREAATILLSWFPPGFPHVRSDGLSPERRHQLSVQHSDVLDQYHTEFLGEDLTLSEHRQLKRLQKVVAADLATPSMLPLLFTRADAFINKREMGLGYDATTNRYYLLVYVLTATSKYKHALKIPPKTSIVDVNNPAVKFMPSPRPVRGILFKLKFGTHQQRILAQARRETDSWKETELQRRATKKSTKPEQKTEYSGGTIRSGSLHACYDTEAGQWGFEARIIIGTNPAYPRSPDHSVGVHVHARHGLVAAVTSLRGELVAIYELDESRITHLLRNPDAEYQKNNIHRTAKEYHHRVADALCEIAHRHRAIIGIENTEYHGRLASKPTSSDRNGSDSIRTIAGLLVYKLPLKRLFPPFEIKGISPTRDCGACGYRHVKSMVTELIFTCAQCSYRELRWINTAREVARRSIWSLALTKPPKPVKNS